jgi:putative tricarboxylic transport membrane protein
VSISQQRHTTKGPHPDSGGRISRGEFALSLGLLALGGAVVLDGIGQPEAKSASGIGPGFFPLVVGSLLIVASLMLTVQVLRGKRGEPEDAEGDVDTSRLRTWQLLVTGGAIIGFMVTLDILGYIPAAAITFWLIAFAMGSVQHVRSAMIAILLAVGIYLLFTQLLRIDLPAGILGGIV